jgi:hypothetical protein
MPPTRHRIAKIYHINPCPISVDRKNLLLDAAVKTRPKLILGGIVEDAANLVATGAPPDREPCAHMLAWWEAANGTRLSGRALQCFIEIDCSPNATQSDASCRDLRRFEPGARRQTNNSVFFWPNLNPPPPQLPGPGSPPLDVHLRFQVSGRAPFVSLCLWSHPTRPAGYLAASRSSLRFSGVRGRADSSSTPSRSLSPRHGSASGMRPEGVDAAWTRRG